MALLMGNCGVSSPLIGGLVGIGNYPSKLAATMSPSINHRFCADRRKGKDRLHVGVVRY